MIPGFRGAEHGHRRARLAIGVVLLCLSSITSAADEGGNELLGTWRNAKDSVHVHIQACGSALCGVVVWANEKAKRDAREGGTDPLVGINLLRDFVRTGDARWRGRVFVPDLGKTVTGPLK